MILLAKRHTLRDLLRKVLERRWGVGKTRPLVYVPSLEMLVKEQGSPRSRFLVVDLGSCCGDDRQATIRLSDWYRDHLWLQPVLVLSPTLGTDAQQLYMYDSLKSVFPWATALHELHLGSDAHWDEIHRRALTREFADEIVKEVEAAIGERPFPKKELVLNILRVAPRTNQVQELCDILQRTRTWLHEELRDANLPQPKELLIRCRALWASKLHRNNWGKEAIARYLGNPSVRECRRQFERYNWSLDVLFEQEHQQLVQTVSAILTS